MSTDNTFTLLFGSNTWCCTLHAMNLMLKFTFDGFVNVYCIRVSIQNSNHTYFQHPMLYLNIWNSLISWISVLLLCWDLFWVIHPSPGLPSKVTCDLMSSHYEPFKIWQMTWRVEWSILIGSGRPIPTSIIPRHEMRQWAKNKRAFQNRELSKVISTTGGLE